MSCKRCENDDLATPWRTRALWRQINETIAATVQDHQKKIQRLNALADQIRSRIESLDQLMHALCSATCPWCHDSCCQRATVWFDFKDLLGFHLVGAPIPPGQPVTKRNQICRYLASRGCTLPRPQRPFVCTWFICNAQKYELMRWPKSQRVFLWNSIKALKKGRAQLETRFVEGLQSGPQV